MSLMGFLLRLIFAAVLVFGTLNPTGTSYYHWIAGGFEADLPLKVLAGVLLLIGYVICVRATFRSIGIVGMGLIIALLGAIGWVLYDYGLLNVENPGLIQWLILLGVALILAIGLSWSHLRRMISGQADMDDVGA